jgi:hypothetical protein
MGQTEYRLQGRDEIIFTKRSMGSFFTHGNKPANGIDIQKGTLSH